jgi:hypothetical protein
MAADVQRDRMMQQPIEDGCGDDAIAEDFALCGKALVAGEDHGDATPLSAERQAMQSALPLALSSTVRADTEILPRPRAVIHGDVRYRGSRKTASGRKC